MKTLIKKKVGWSTAAVTLALLCIGAAAAEPAGTDAYLTDTAGNLVRNSYGECWRTGYWTPELAIRECDPDLFPPEAEPEPEAALPLPMAITLSSEALFDFDRAVVRPESAQRLSEEVLGPMAKYPKVEAVQITGHTDRVGSEAYNQALSERRATAVAEYLVNQGIDASLVTTTGKGESEPLVSCDEVTGRENRYNKALVECLQPNRRAVVEIQVQEQPSAE
jgi:OOP family OmpA-OmpF porin